MMAGCRVRPVIFQLPRLPLLATSMVHSGCNQWKPLSPIMIAAHKARHGLARRDRGVPLRQRGRQGGLRPQRQPGSFPNPIGHGKFTGRARPGAAAALSRRPCRASGNQFLQGLLLWRCSRQSLHSSSSRVRVRLAIRFGGPTRPASPKRMGGAGSGHLALGPFI